MLSEIEKLLETKTNGKRSRIFYTQWQVAKDYIPQVLSTITQVFPHYSLHDYTHSESIINNIGRVVGLNTLERMSSIDLWLILTASLYHDIGMAVFSNEKIGLFQTQDFIDFLNTCQSEKSSPLHDYSMCFEIKNNRVYYINDIISSKNYDAARFLLAEFIRKHHGERSESSIHSDLSVNLPGSPIPNRIINVLGNICNAHTQSFDKVMELPFCEVGIDHEDCHPRYISCLLRLGDLLDIDNNRFSEVLLQTLPSLPIDSIHHKNKHLSIKHIQVNDTKIEACAECDDYDVADITNRWFTMIDSELYSQMKNWNSIVPDSSYGFLPTLGKMDVKLKNYDTINGKDRPSFKIDSSKAIELLQGAGLYTEPYQSVRELLQNAVDATLLRIFIESEQNRESINERKVFFNKCNKYPIKVIISKEKIEGDKITWVIKISDCGIGMSKNDLLYLTTTGSSNKNNEKKKIVDRMPEWMKPSGTFGIGFQSVFLLTDIVTLKTRKYNKEEVLNVELFNPAGSKNGSVLIQTYLDEYRTFGTDLEFKLVTKTIPNNWSVSIIPFSVATEVVHSYDFINDDSLDIDIAKIIDEIKNFANASYIPIYIKVDDQNEINLNDPHVNINKIFPYFEDKYGLELSISSSKMNSSNIYYRNQLVEKARFPIHFLSFQINILSGDAKDILTLDRNSIQSEYYHTLQNNVMSAVYNILKTRYGELDEETRKYASMFIDFYYDNEQKKVFSNPFLNEWGNLLIGENQKKSIKDILEYNTILFKKDRSYSKEMKLKEDDDRLEIICSTYGNELLDFITYKYKSKNVKFYSKPIEERKDAYIELSKGDGDINVEIEDWKLWFDLYLSHQSYARNLMPCIDKYKHLRIKDLDIIRRCRDFTFNIVIQDYPQMVCPYIRKQRKGYVFRPEKLEKSLSDKLYQYVYDNRFYEHVTMEQIKNTYKQFIDDTQQYVQNLLTEE